MCGDAIRTERLTLRSYEPADAAALERFLQANAERLRGLAVPWGLDREQETDGARYVQRVRMGWLLGSIMVFGIWPHGDAEIAGEILLFGNRDRRVEVGYYLAAPAEGRGFASEAIRAVCAFAFERLEAERVIARCDSANARSRRAAQRAGFAIESERDGITHFSLARP